MDNKNYMYMMMAEHHEKKGEIEKAEEFYLKSLANNPSSKAHERMGLILKSRDDMNGARLHFESALKIQSENRVCLYNMAILERLDGNYEKSMEKYLKLLELGCEDAGVYMSMGVLNSEMGNLREALELYKKSFDKNPMNDLVRFNYSLCLMTLGDYEKGLEFYESRIWHAKPPGEEWMGEQGISLLIAPEQGNGDIIQFSRYIPMLKEKCEKITVLCNAPLMEIIKNVEGVNEVIEFNPGDEFVESNAEADAEEGLSKPLPFDKYVRIMSLPHKLGLDPRSIPFQKQIHISPEKIEFWRHRMTSSKPKIGLCWQGGKRSKPDMVAIDKRRSMKLKEFAKIVEDERFEFFSLQKGDDQGRDFPRIIDFMEECNDFTDTAAIIENLDLVITVDTAIAHLAASLQKPTWMLSRKGGCWRWGHEGESTFWYPSMRIFRQEIMNEWEIVVQRVHEALKNL